MSVVDPRPAAAQRTAASRTRVLATWLVAVPLLAFFSFSVVAGAATFDKTPPAAKAVDKLPKDTKAVVELPASPKGDGLLERLTHAATLVCTVNSTQLARIQQLWRTSTVSLSVNSRTLSVVSVYGANEADLRGTLGNPQCVLVQVARTFFLPFDAHTS
jgi:hypothetical protein